MYYEKSLQGTIVEGTDINKMIQDELEQYAKDYPAMVEEWEKRQLNKY